MQDLGLNKQRLGELIDLIGTIGLGDRENRSKDILGRVYEYFLGQFADAEGKKGGQFYTPRSIVRLLVEMLEPYRGKDFRSLLRLRRNVCSEREIRRSTRRKNWGRVNLRAGKQSDNLAAMQDEYSHYEELMPRLSGGILSEMTNSRTSGPTSFWLIRLSTIAIGVENSLQDDSRWKFGIPPKGNANFAWVQHFIQHLSPTGIAGFVLANGSMSSDTSNEGEIRKNIIEADLVDCMVALPSQLFYNTMIPACLWFVSRDKRNHKFRDRSRRGTFH